MSDKDRMAGHQENSHVKTRSMTVEQYLGNQLSKDTKMDTLDDIFKTISKNTTGQ